MTSSGRPVVLICSYLEPEHVERIRSTVPVEVLDAPELLPVPRYRNDHTGRRRALTADQDQRWTELLAAADICFDFDWRAPADLPATAPRLRWVQGTSAGLGGFLQRTGLDRSAIGFTTAAGVHAAPLSEFAVTAALYFAKDIPRIRAHQRSHHWERHVSGMLSGRRAAVIGLGAIGRQVVRSLAALGVCVTGVGRPGISYEVPGADAVVGTDELDALLPRVDLLVLACPLTPDTDNLVDAGRVASLPDGAIVVNIARGQVIDQGALTSALQAGSLAGAALDVFAVEPLPDDSPLWDLDNVIVSPHSASTAVGENAAITELFIDNLGRHLTGEPLRNTYHADRGY